MAGHRLSVIVYSVSTVDNAPVETALFSGAEVPGFLEVARWSIFKEDQTNQDKMTELLFIPDKMYTGLARGLTMKDGSTSYTVLAVDDFDDHHEITCRQI